MITTLKNSMAVTFFNSIGSANNSILLCAPFIKSDIIEKVLEDNKNTSSLEVIASSNIANFYAKASDTKAIQLLLDKQAKVKNFQQLHAKIYMFDETKAIIISANLTHSGLYTNYEYVSYLIMKSN
jgi:phosphatidylserine/phosphatidylglycerophosphate/cardiolipin synthase-like enzyme